MKFQNSAIAATSLSKKSGGTVATINNIFRIKSNPRQPRTSKQTAARARLVSTATTWGTLTEAQQNAWIIAAPSYVFFRNGEAYTLKGSTLYTHVNNVLINAGQDPIVLPAVPVAAPDTTGPVIEQGLIFSTDPSIWFVWAPNRPWNNNPIDDWTPAFLWTGWILPSRYSFPKATRRIDIQPNSQVSSGWAITWSEDPNTQAAPYSLGLKAQLIEKYVNKITGQTFIANNYELHVGAYTAQYNPPGYAIGSAGDTVTIDGDDIFVNVVFTNTGNDLDLEMWVPYIKWSGWQADDWDENGPLELIIPDTAIEQTGDNEITVHFGPTEGMAPEPELGQIMLIAPGFRENGSGPVVAFIASVIFAVED